MNVLWMQNTWLLNNTQPTFITCIQYFLFFHTFFPSSLLSLSPHCSLSPCISQISLCSQQNLIWSISIFWCTDCLLGLAFQARAALFKDYSIEEIFYIVIFLLWDISKHYIIQFCTGSLLSGVISSTGDSFKCFFSLSLSLSIFLTWDVFRQQEIL